MKNYENLHFLKMSWILMKNIPSWSKFSQEFDGIDEKSPNPQLRGEIKKKNLEY